VLLFCGLALFLFGVYIKISIKDRYFILNIISKDRRLISEKKVIRELKIADYKLREYQIDIVRMFNTANNITHGSCKYMIEEIKEKTRCFIDQSKDFKKAFTGMFSIPFTVFAGTILSATDIDEYLEYNSSTQKYYKLKSKRLFKWRMNYESLNINNPTTSSQSNEAVVAISITRQVNDNDLVKFAGMDIIKIGLEVPKDNIINYKDQLNEYTQTIIDKIEDMKSQYNKINLVGAFPSCLSIELGRKISLRDNRLPEIVCYQYKDGNYVFGIVVTQTEKGKLINL